MATINDIATAASYRGTPGLGGATAIGITIDTSPIQKLGTFLFYKDRDLWQQKVKKENEAAEQIALISAFDINSALVPYREALNKQLNIIQEKIQSNPKALSYNSKDPQAYLDLQKEINKFKNLRTSATQSDTIAVAQQAAIDKEPDEGLRALKQRKLDKIIKNHFVNGVDAVLGKPLKSMDDIKPDDYKVPSVVTASREFFTKLPNDNKITTLTFIDTDVGLANAEMSLVGIGKKSLDEENPEWFRALDEEDKEIARQEHALLNTKLQTNNRIVSEFNSLKAQWEQENKGIDITTISGDPTGKETLVDIIKIANNYNKQIIEANRQLASGQVKDANGNVITKQLSLINVKDGLSAAELVLLKSLQESGKSILDTKVDVKNTDDALQQQNINQEWAKINDARTAALQSGKPEDAILAVNEYMTEHGQRIKQFFENNKNEKVVEVDIGNADDYIKKALNLEQKFDTENNEIVGADAKTGNTYTQDRNGNIVVYHKWTENGKKMSKVIGKATPKILRQKISEAMFGTGTTESVPGATQTKVEAGNSLSLDQQPEFKKTYKHRGKEYSIDLIKEKAKLSGMTVEEYIKAAKLE